MADTAASAPPHLRSAVLGAVPHGFFGRKGGASTGAIAGLNCGWGAGDDPQVVAANRRAASEAILPSAPLVALHQIHSPDVVVVDEPWGDDARPHADGSVTARRGVVLGIVTADCAPVLFADEIAGVIGAAHAGWRGAFGGVLEATVAAMVRLGASMQNITAAIGPAIAQPSYEVDDGFRAQFTDKDACFFAQGKPGHWQFDLAGYCVARLNACGVTQIDTLAHDTYTESDAYFSYRRATHLGEPNYGRQLSLIALA